MDLFLIVKQDFRNLRNYPQRTNKVRETNDQREDSAHLKKDVWLNPNKKTRQHLCKRVLVLAQLSVSSLALPHGRSSSQ